MIASEVLARLALISQYLFQWSPNAAHYSDFSAVEGP